MNEANVFDVNRIAIRIEEACRQYDKTAPTVVSFLDSIYSRLSEEHGTGEFTVAELQFVNRLFDGREWMQPNLAANLCYKLMSRLGFDTTGHAGF